MAFTTASNLQNLIATANEVFVLWDWMGLSAAVKGQNRVVALLCRLCVLGGGGGLPASNANMRMFVPFGLFRLRRNGAKVLAGATAPNLKNAPSERLRVLRTLERQTSFGIGSLSRFRHFEATVYVGFAGVVFRQDCIYVLEGQKQGLFRHKNWLESNAHLPILGAGMIYVCHPPKPAKPLSKEV